MSELNKSLDREILKILTKIQNQSYWHKLWLYAQTFGEKTVRSYPEIRHLKLLTTWSFLTKLDGKNLEIVVTDTVYHISGFRVTVSWDNQVVFSAFETSKTFDRQLIMVADDKLFVKVPSNYIYNNGEVDLKEKINIVNNQEKLTGSQWIEIEYFNHGDWEKIIKEIDAYTNWFEREAKRKAEEFEKLRYNELDQKEISIVKKLNIDTRNLT